MPLKNTLTKYGSVHKFFHWTIALLIIFMLCLGYYMNSLPNNPDKFYLVGLHKSLGITILILAVFRLAWKLKNISPPLPTWMSKLDKFGANAVHTLLYALMIAMPLSGWAMSAAAGYHVSVFGLFTLPDLVAADKTLSGYFREFHNLTAWVIIAFVSLHVLAALLHHFYYRDNILRRMFPFAKLKDENAADIRPIR